MKVLLTWRDNGESFDDYQDWIHKAYLVPDDFDKESFKRSFYNKAKELGYIKNITGNAVEFINFGGWENYLEAEYAKRFQEITVI